MKPASLAVGNILTLTACRYGRKPLGGEWGWRETTSHRMLGKPRPIVAARSAFVEIGEERSRLDYPKRGEFTESHGKLTLRYLGSGNGTCADICTELTYKVESPAT